MAALTIAELIALIGALVAVGGLLHKWLSQRTARKDLAHREAEAIWEDASEWRQEQNARINTLARIVKAREVDLADARRRIECLERQVLERDRIVAELHDRIAALAAVVEQFQRASCGITCERREALVMPKGLAL